MADTDGREVAYNQEQLYLEGNTGSDESKDEYDNDYIGAFFQWKDRHIVELNVGGHHYTTTIQTLRREESMLSAMFSGKYKVSKDSKGRIFIDRDGKTFREILNYLRSGTIPPYTDNYKPEKLQLFLQEAQFFAIPSLSSLYTPPPSRHIWKFGKAHPKITLSKEGIFAENTSSESGSYVIAVTSEGFEIPNSPNPASIYFEIVNTHIPSGSTAAIGIANQFMAADDTHSGGWSSTNQGIGLYLNSGNYFKCGRKLGTIKHIINRAKTSKFAIYIVDHLLYFICDGEPLVDPLSIPKRESSKFYFVAILTGGCTMEITNNPPPQHLVQRLEEK